MKYLKIFSMLLSLAALCACASTKEETIQRFELPDDWVECSEESQESASLARNEVIVYDQKFQLDLADDMYIDAPFITGDYVQVDVYEYLPRSVEQACTIIFSKTKQSDQFKAIEDIWYAEYVYTKEVSVCPSA